MYVVVDGGCVCVLLGAPLILFICFSFVLFSFCTNDPTIPTRTGTKNEDLDDSDSEDEEVEQEYQVVTNYHKDDHHHHHATKTNSRRTSGGPLKVRLSQVFTDYDVNGNGTLDVYEIWALLIETRSYIPQDVLNSKLGGKLPHWTQEDAEVIVQTLDDDNNGVVEREEFISWVMRGLEKIENDPDSITIILNSNEMGRKMGSFILAMNAFVVGPPSPAWEGGVICEC